MTNETSFLALISIPGGGSWYRASDRETAIKGAMRIFKADWSHLYKVKKGTTIRVNVRDVTGVDRVTWDDSHVEYDGVPSTVPWDVEDRTF